MHCESSLTLSSNNCSSKTRAKPTQVELGFAEPCEDPAFLESHFFPSKIGGKPAWLGFDPLPSQAELACGICKEPCVFLLQVYAPIYERPDCFHRTIFLFICRNPKCCQRNQAANLRVFRSQLPRKNSFYGFEPTDPDFWDPGSKAAQQVKRVTSFLPVCAVCGCGASLDCEHCVHVKYCSVVHRDLHWSFEHQSECKGNQPPEANNQETAPESMDTSAANGDEETIQPNQPGTAPSNSAKRRARKNKKRKAQTQVRSLLEHYLFPELEIVTEPETLEPETLTKGNTERPEHERMRDYQQAIAGLPTEVSSPRGGVGANDLEALEECSVKLDKSFKAFQRRVAQNNEQVLRYQRGAEPLLAVELEGGSKMATARKCGNCGGPTVFEFQVMPHLLTILEVDSLAESIDWATLLVYTCEQSCAVSGYAHEVIVKQDFEM